MLGELQRLWPAHACREFLRALPLVDFQPHSVPQLQPLSQLLRCRPTSQARMLWIAPVPAAEVLQTNKARMLGVKAMRHEEGVDPAPW